MLKFHRYADVFPMMTGNEFEQLKNDIQKNGLEEPIVLHEGKIIDGRNRYLACLAAKAKPKFKNWDGKGSLIDFIISRNLHRRHLNESQKAVCALAALPFLKEEAKVRQRLHGGTAPGKSGKTLGQKIDEVIPDNGRAAENAAKFFGTNRQYVADAEKIARESPKYIEKIKAGELTIPKAKEQVKAESRKKTLIQAASDGDDLSPQQERMVEKFQRLAELEERGVYFGSVWAFGPRENYAGESTYHGNCIPQIVENALLLYTQPGDLVLDPMAGSGTTVDVCAAIDRKCLAFDLTANNHKQVKHGDARKLPCENYGVDFIFWHPPYWNLVKYSNDQRDLSALDWNGFLSASNDVLVELHRLLRANKYLCILSGDRIKDGKFYSVTNSIVNFAGKVGFTHCGEAIKITKNSQSQIIKGKTIWAELAYSQNLRIEHDTINIFKKV